MSNISNLQTKTKTKSTTKSNHSIEKNPKNLEIQNHKINSIFKSKLQENSKNSPDSVAKTLQIQLETANKKLEIDSEKGFNQTEFILKWSKFSNGVAQKHQQITAQNYPNHKIECITNGVHLPTWLSPHLSKLFDKYLQNWQTDNFSLKLAEKIPLKELEIAKKSAKKDLFEYIKKTNNLELDENIFTIGFARRAVAYKRADFIFEDLDKLAKIAEKFGGIQLIFSGKAHPNDQVGREMIKRVYDKMSQINKQKFPISVVYLANYNMEISKLMVAGSDIWLNNPTPPLEASGTSGMKAALNGVPNFSILDGWWLEGWIENVTGWSIGTECKDLECNIEQISELYQKLENVILPLFQNKNEWLKVCQSAIILNGSHFGTDRTVMEYLTRAWLK